jgi:hypothetical protein
MKIFQNRSIVTALKIYLCAVLTAAAVLSTPASSVAAVLTLLIYLFFQWQPVFPFADMLVTWFGFFAVVTLFYPLTNIVISNVIALPLLLLMTASLIKTAAHVPKNNTAYPRSLTNIGITLPLITLIIIIFGLFLNNYALVLAGSIAILFLGVLIGLSIYKISAKSVIAEKIQQRMLAGASADLQINLLSQTGFGGMLFVESPYQWLKIHTPELLLVQENIVLKLYLSPSLSGPSDVQLRAYMTDCWGLTQFQFQFSPLQLIVIPRARYAGWLAKRYLAATKPGLLPLISNVSTVKPQFAYRRGIEYYGSQIYQPGDELKNIDWKHSVKYNKLISKEFVEFHGQPAVLLINLAAANAEEADELSQKIITTAISLARESIPTVITAYDQNGVKVVTPTLQPRRIVLQSMEITKEITLYANPARYLHTPAVSRLRANIARLASVEGDAPKILSQLLNIEYVNLMNNVTVNPATLAIYKALDNANIQSTIVVVSMLNHDINAIATNTYLMSKRGYAIVTV